MMRRLTDRQSNSVREVTAYLWILRAIGIICLIGIGKYTNWQTAVLLFFAIWSNNAYHLGEEVRRLQRERSEKENP